MLLKKKGISKEIVSLIGNVFIKENVSLKGNILLKRKCITERKYITEKKIYHLPIKQILHHFIYLQLH